MKLAESQGQADDSGRAKLYADIAHPINTSCREMIQQHVVRAYEEELERSKQPDYIPSYSDFTDFGEEGTDYAQSGPHFGLNAEKEKESETKKTGFGEGVFE